MTSSIVISEPTRALLAGETMGSFVRWLAKFNLNIKRNLTSMFVTKYLPYMGKLQLNGGQLLW